MGVSDTLFGFGQKLAGLHQMNSYDAWRCEGVLG
jgi:hypothetical protein